MKNKERDKKIIRKSQFPAISTLMLDFLSIYDEKPMNFVKRTKIADVVPVIDNIIERGMKKLWYQEYLFNNSDKVLFTALQEYAEMKNLEKFMPDELSVQNSMEIAPGESQQNEFKTPLPIIRMSRRREDLFNL